MSPRLKKFIGLFILLPGLVIYLLLAAALADIVPQNQILKFAYFAFAGVAWAFPVKYLIMWMNAEN